MFQQRTIKQIIAVLIFWEIVGPNSRELGMEIKILTERTVKCLPPFIVSVQPCRGNQDWRRNYVRNV